MAHIVIIDMYDRPCFSVIRDTGRRGYYSNGPVFCLGARAVILSLNPLCGAVKRARLRTPDVFGALRQPR